MSSDEGERQNIKQTDDRFAGVDDDPAKRQATALDQDALVIGKQTDISMLGMMKNIQDSMISLA